MPRTSNVCAVEVASKPGTSKATRRAGSSRRRVTERIGASLAYGVEAPSRRRSLTCTIHSSSSSRIGETPGARPSYFFAIQSWCPRSVFRPRGGQIPKTMANTSYEIGAPLSRPPMSLVSRFIGIITSPKATFEAVVAHPRWFGMLALTTVIIAIGVSLPLTTEGGQQSQVDQQVRLWRGFGAQVGDQQYARWRRACAIAAISSFASIAGRRRRS